MSPDDEVTWCEAQRDRAWARSEIAYAHAHAFTRAARRRFDVYTHAVGLPASVAIERWRRANDRSVAALRARREGRQWAECAEFVNGTAWMLAASSRVRAMA